MRNKLFLAFLLVILTALISNLIFVQLIMNDFDEYMKGTREDHLYWVMASVEGSYHDGTWDMNLLSETIHWGMMLGFDIRVEDRDGTKLADSHSVMGSLPPAMKRRMESIIHVHGAEGDYERYPLYIEDRELGTLLVRPLTKSGTGVVKETIFKRRGWNFLIMSFVIAGAGAVAMAVFFSLYLSRPIKKLKAAADRVARGDFSVRVEQMPPSRLRLGRFLGDEIAALSERFDYMAEALEKEEGLRKRLTSNIAHELRTPLAIMKAQVEAMIDGVIEDRSEGLETVRIELEKLTRLVEGIEDLTKAEASFFAPGEHRRVNLKEFLREIESSIEPVFHEKGLQFTMLGNADIDVVTDFDKLERILKNIISNSLKYTEEGGVSLDYGKVDGEFFVEVRDTGIGIPEEELPNIFKRFYRGRERPDKGIGIGLSIVKELVDVMGGRIEVRSEVKEGTAFRIWLPDERKCRG
ncbi:MAG TPA: HAMP domain-containing sensor histidine kinase [Thermodesulfovibrionales bacterium]|nr:HAMP domain-containing sensor histidine kinase [Thermodesulfovibrionales bacterium]